MSGGILSVAANESVGLTSTGTFTQSGGINSSATFGLGSGSYGLGGSGQLSAQSENLGGVFSQSGGTNFSTLQVYVGSGLPSLLVERRAVPEQLDLVRRLQCQRRILAVGRNQQFLSNDARLFQLRQLSPRRRPAIIGLRHRRRLKPGNIRAE